MTHVGAEGAEASAAALAPRRKIRLFSPMGSLVALAQALQEGAERLHLGPHGLCTVSVSVEGELRLLRPRAEEVMQATAGMDAWRVLWRAFLADTPTKETKALTGADNQRTPQLPDGQGRLLITSAALLRHLISPTAHYPVIDSPSSQINRLRLVRVLRELTTPGAMRDVPIAGDEDSSDVEQRGGSDMIGRVVRASLRSLQPYVYGAAASAASKVIPRHVVEGCFHFTMCTEVEDDVLTTLRQLLIRFLWSSSFPNEQVTSASIVARAQGVLLHPTSYIVPCKGDSVLYSCVLPFGTFLLPTVSPEISPHHGTATPFFSLEYRTDDNDSDTNTGQPARIMLLRIDDQGGLLDFAHSNKRKNADSESGYCTSEGSNDGRRVVERQWTTAEQEKAQLEAARLLYTWANKHGVTAILTPSQAPPVIKTYGRRYGVTDKTSEQLKHGRPIFMVDEVDDVVFDALLRRLQYWRHSTNAVKSGVPETPVCCPTVALLRRGGLVLPDLAEDALLPVRRLVYGPLRAVCSSATVREFMVSESCEVRVALLELDQSALLEKGMNSAQGVWGIGSMLLVGPTVYQRCMYTNLLLKCLASVRRAMDASPSGGGTSPECGLGFVRAGGALPIALARQLRLSAEALTRPLPHVGGARGKAEEAGCHWWATTNMPVVDAVLRMLAEAVLEVPRRLAAHLIAQHRPLRHAWLRLESDAVDRATPCSVNSIIARDPPLHVCIREDVAFYRRSCVPPLCDAGATNTAAHYFCCSDTESSDDDSDGEDAGQQEHARRPPPLSFVEPIATTADVLRGAVTLLRLTLMSDAGALDPVGM
ncbi:hypothetical protein TraAM80_01473 [Trypanosoma rangeli]|uniref:Uncharacterized protein n=1 Tax=Trypanosoma rangeli TaxID=5698 RepID=A0A3R7LAR1_TRYRA|nr:uncharacterized protein TraAM80_01473 [Trypanosoma rangeli]RNF10548.1 hypothetical protein TraAM80_01473 [Trypanosoma rangeli]|eukprot:RNF10548.1 hypothetical protein TraAM80_01473 [Trypanosoma rangeli]